MLQYHLYLWEFGTSVFVCWPFAMFRSPPSNLFGVSPILSGLRLPWCRPVRSRKPPMRKVLKLQPSSIFQIFPWKQTDWMVKWIKHFAPRKALWGGRDSAWGLECEASTELARVTWLHTYIVKRKGPREGPNEWAIPAEADWSKTSQGKSADKCREQFVLSCQVLFQECFEISTWFGVITYHHKTLPSKWSLGFQEFLLNSV